MAAQENELVTLNPNREKVIKGLESEVEYAKNLDQDWIDCVEVSLLKGALELLKAQEPDKDWISKKRLQDEIQYYIDEAGWGEEINKALGWCLEFIDNQEAVKWDD